MKITKEKLQKLIKEELELVLSEQSLINEGMHTKDYRAIVLAYLEALLKGSNIPVPKVDMGRGLASKNYQGYGRD